MDLKQRLSSVIATDKRNNPKYISSVIKSDFYYLINNYFEVDFDDINININLNESKYNISISCNADRIKLVRALPQ